MHYKCTFKRPEAPSQRVLDRPRVADWGLDELLTLPEAAHLCWPNGPITTATLRTAERKMELGVTVIASKFFTTRRAIEAMSTPSIRKSASKKAAAPAPAVPHATFEPKVPARTTTKQERLQALERMRRRG